jgi:hypothetical protein
MGIFSQAEKQISQKQLAEINNFLLEGETIVQAYTLLLDYAALTNLRVLFVEKDGGETVLNSIAYNKITGLAMSKAWLSSKSVTIYASGIKAKISFLSSENAPAFYKAIAERTI